MTIGNSCQNISIKFFSRKNKKFCLHSQYLKLTIKWIILIGEGRKKKEKRSIGDLIQWGEDIKTDLKHVN